MPVANGSAAHRHRVAGDKDGNYLGQGLWALRELRRTGAEPASLVIPALRPYLFAPTDSAPICRA